MISRMLYSHRISTFQAALDDIHFAERFPAAGSISLESGCSCNCRTIWLTGTMPNCKERFRYTGKKRVSCKIVGGLEKTMGTFQSSIFERSLVRCESRDEGSAGA